jgi:aspartate kinase
LGLKVFKFGGASVKDAAAVRNLVRIVKDYGIDNLIVVVSAMGKTTNALEKVIDDYYHGNPGLQADFQKIRDYHKSITGELFGEDSDGEPAKVNSLFDELSAIISQPVTGSYDENYDRIVAFGELISTAIIHAYLLKSGIKSKWFDVRKLIITDDFHREARVKWDITRQRIKAAAGECGKSCELMITQGFIAGDENGNTTTLGREGSDFSGAIIAYSADAESLTIWKDVPGLLNADPKYFNNTQKIDTISYGETVELAYYGATIIHPKTIKPLQNKKIPLYVRSFLSPANQGTVIHTDQRKDHLIPSYIFKRNQVLISISPRDYSFMDEENIAVIFSALAKFHIKVNMMQNSAISFSVCVDSRNHRVEKFIDEIKTDYRVRYNSNLELLTIRHYTPEVVERIAGKRKILLEQRSRTTLQLVLASSKEYYVV